MKQPGTKEGQSASELIRPHGVRRVENLSFHSVVLIVVVATLVVNVALWMLLGSRTGGDTLRYIDGARRVLAGEALSDRQQVYFGYIYVLAALRWLDAPLAFIYVGQIAASALAGVAAAGLGRHFGGNTIALFSGLVWAGFYEIHKWNTYILTDGLFVSFVMASCWLVVRARSGPLLPALLAVVAMATFRFNGIVFALILLVQLAIVRRGASKAHVIAAMLVVILLPTASPITNLYPASTEGTAQVQSGTLSFLVEGHVIWDTVKIAMPAPPAPSGSVVRDVIAYAVRHPLAVARLYALRLGHYLLAYNPFFSFRHIVGGTLLWLVVYALSIMGLIVASKRFGVEIRWLLLLWVSQALLVMLTVGDYDGRFSLYAVPALIPLVAIGLASWTSQPERAIPETHQAFAG